MYLMIENNREAPVESFTIFGASTSRGENDKIGQFGSGAKFGTLVCMRLGINPVIYCGKQKIEFFAEPMQMSGKNFSRVCYRHGNKTYKTSYTLEFGALDWDKADMALREFISNAIDSSDSKQDVNIKIVHDTRASSGKTRVFVPLTPDVQRYYNEIHKHFLHFSADSAVNETKYGLIEKTEKSVSKAYRCGVFVREMSSLNGLFDYNFDQSVSIDECRNMSDFSVKYGASKLLSRMTKKQFGKVMDCLVKGEKTFETEIESFYTIYSSDWANWFIEKFGDSAVLVDQQTNMFAEKVKNKGYTAVYISNPTWYKALTESGIKTAIDVLDSVNTRGHEFFDASETTMATAKRVWGWLETLGVTKGKQLPKIREFVNIMDGGEYNGGYVDDDIVHIEKDQAHSTKVMLEELAHYVTGSTDNSRDFQDYAFKVASMLGEILA